MSPETACAAGGLVLTGERTLPGIPDENYWFRRHEAAYRALLPFLLVLLCGVLLITYVPWMTSAPLHWFGK